MPQPDDQVHYDWPEGGGAPFDAAPDETRWVLVCRGHFGRTWPAGDDLDFGSSSDFAARVPMGYASIAIVERRAVVDGGRVVREWAASDRQPPGPVSDPYQHHVPGFEADPVYEVLDGRGSRRGPDGEWAIRRHDSYAAALDDATSTDGPALVVTGVTSRGWH